MPSPFVHLHVHTHYSLLDGACRVDKLIKRTKELGMDSIAITDHGCMYGVVEFFNECKKEGIKPILGMEAYMAPGDRRERSTPGGNAGEAAYHLLLLAENLAGYKNLVRLSSLAYREGFYYKPRIDKEILRQYSKGLIATSACLGGEVCSAFMKRDAKVARHAAETYSQIFGPERFFIEVQKQGIKEQDMVNPELEELAGKLGVGLVATNDVHFLNKDDHHAHDVLCCISMGKQVSDEGRLKYPTEIYLKSPQEMIDACGHFDQAIENTVRIAEMCKLDLDFSKRFAPVYKVPTEKLRSSSPWLKSESSDFDPSGATENAVVQRRNRLLPRAASTGIQPVPNDANGAGEHGLQTRATEIKDDEKYLRQLCEDGLQWRYGTTDVSSEIRARLEYELKIICMKNFCSYFLIVWDFCNYARECGIPVGARGSGVGTMVGYLLGLCNVDPIKYGLLFERFMDPSRNEMPDIDIDICQDGRQKVIEYVRKKYGHVAQIITFGTLAAKAACKDVGRVLGVPLAEIDRLTKLIPGTPGMTLDKAMKQVPDLSDLYDKDTRIREVIDLAKKLEGLCRNSGVHAAGVIIADQELDSIIPMCKDKDDNPLTQFEGPIAEKCGLLKMDFLGLRTLTTLQRSIDLVKQTKGETIDIEHIDFTDRKVLDTFCRGETKGIFQFESGGMQDLLMKMQPDRIEDLIAANALYRPGPMELIPLYCNRKHGKERVPEVHPIMDAILKETYGIMVYQEQVMQIFNQLGGIELSNAYKLIKAISKKNVEIIAKFQPDFIKGTMDKGVSKDKAQEIFELILKFGGYGFNKSHSTRYAIVAFQTAYMKTYHPVEYMAAVLTFEMGSTEKVVEYIEECRKMGLKVLPPDVNVSDKDFTPVYERDEETKRRRDEVKDASSTSSLTVSVSSSLPPGTIRFGMCAVKGVGEKAVEGIITERQKSGAFRSIYDFCERVDTRVVQRSTIEALIKCGAFSSISPRRAPLLQVFESAFEAGQRAQDDKRSGQMSIFGAPESSPASSSRVSDSLPNIDELPSQELLKFEKDLLGFYITSHPLTEHQSALERYSTATTREAMQLSEGVEVTIGGMISRVKKVVTKNGRSAGMPMAIITLEDLDGQIDGTMFAETYAEIIKRYPGSVEVEQIVFVKGKIDRKRETPSLLINEVLPMSDALPKLTTTVVLKLDCTRHNTDHLKQIRPRLASHKGNLPLFVQTESSDGQKVILKLPKDLSVRPTLALIEEIDQLLGSGSIQLFGDGIRRMKRLQQQALFKEAEHASTESASAPSDEQVSQQMDAEEQMLQEA